MNKLNFCLIACLLALANFTFAAQLDVLPPQDFLQFDGFGDYVEVADSTDFSVSTTGGLTVSAWMRPDILTFPSEESTGYVHWLGKGELNQQEWTFRMYGLDNTDVPFRENRISFYVFNNGPGRGCGSYFQDPVQAGQWIHVVGVINDAVTEKTISIYKNGELRATTFYGDTIMPAHAGAPLRFATRDFASFFHGAIAQVRIWNRVLTDAEVSDLHNFGRVPQNCLVAEYLLNEGAGDTAHDTVDAHHGTVVGTMNWGSGSFPLQGGRVQSGGGC